jgi:NADH-quinone oxidoreductase subunit D
VRVGGVNKDMPHGWDDKVLHALGQTDKVMVEVEAMLNSNKIFRDRMAGIGAISREDAIATGCVGPIARAAGVDYDVRKDYPYSIYPEVEFDVPLGTTGDCLDRYLVRIEELKQSVRILRQCFKQIPPASDAVHGRFLIDDHRVALPPKHDAYNTIESMIRHFKFIMDGIKIPAGETYSFVEGGNGELGFFLVADGTGRPYKAYVRSPSFVHLSTASQIMHGHLIADIVPIFGMINMIGGECDK